MFDAMRRVLRTDELLLQIFEHLDPLTCFLAMDGVYRGDAVKCVRAALFNVVLCSRLFCGPALDVLWRWQENPLHLLLLLLPIHDRTPRPRPREATFYRPLKEDWARFDKYARRVRTLVISRGHYLSLGTQFRDIFLEMILRLPNIRLLWVELDVSLSTIRRFSTLTNLYSLTFDADNVEWDRDGEFESGGFPMLQSLRVQGTLPSINLALRLSSFPHIPELSLQIKFSPSPVTSVADSSMPLDADLDKFFPSLRTLFISADHVTFDAIRPILKLRHLQMVQLGSRHGRDNFRLGDEDVCEMARAWPNLVTLLVVNASGALTHWNCLPELARCCPLLEVLELPALWFDTAPVTDHLHPSARKMKAVMLTASCSSPSASDKIKDLITTLFPLVGEADIRQWAE